MENALRHASGLIHPSIRYINTKCNTTQKQFLLKREEFINFANFKSLVFGLSFSTSCHRYCVKVSENQTIRPSDLCPCPEYLTHPAFKSLLYKIVDALFQYVALKTLKKVKFNFHRWRTWSWRHSEHQAASERSTQDHGEIRSGNEGTLRGSEKSRFESGKERENRDWNQEEGRNSGANLPPGNTLQIALSKILVYYSGRIRHARLEFGIQILTWIMVTFVLNSDWPQNRTYLQIF